MLDTMSIMYCAHCGNRDANQFYQPTLVAVGEAGEFTHEPIGIWVCSLCEETVELH